MKEEIVQASRITRCLERTISMSSVLCEAWQRQVQEFFTSLHGHQSKTLAWFVLGAIRAKSVVIPQIALGSVGGK